MPYTIPAIAGESPVVWNGTTYYPVTDWTVSANSGGGESWLHAAVRFLMAEGATETSFHIVAQYATYTTTGSVPNTTHTRNAMLIQRLNTAPTTGVNEAGAEYTGSNAVGKFFTALNVNQRTGYPVSATVTNNIVWYGQPYIVTDLGTVGAGVTLTSKTFYSTMSDVPSSAVSISGTYTTPLETYAITYKSNYTGGAADIVATKVKNTDITISACEFTRTDYHFLHWNTNSGGTGTTYNPSDTYATNAALTLYAIWEPDHVAPYFTNTPTVTRCDSSGVASDEGTGLKVSFTYGKDSASTWAGITKKVEYKLTSSSTWTQALSSADNDSGTYNKYTASITLNQSKAYNIRITLSETFQSKTYSTSFTSFISTTSFSIDMYGDNSVAVGSSAPESVVTDFAGALTLGGAWDEQMILDSTNGVDASLASAILTAGYTGVYNTTNLLSLKKLLSQVIASSSGSGIKGTSEFIVGTQGSSTNAWTGVSEQAALTDGMQITYFLPYATNSSNATLNLTMGDGSTTTGAIPIYRYGTTRLASATYAPANSVIHMTYRSDADAWYLDMDSNTDTTYSAGTGLALSGTTFNHSNAVTAGTIGQTSATSGNTLDVPYATYDAQGHITAKGTHVHTSWDSTTPWLYGDGFINDQKVVKPWPYINALNNGFWSLILRGATVSLSIDGGAAITSNMDKLFDGSYDSTITTVLAGSTAVLTIDFSTMSTGYFPEVGTYPYGDIWLSFYYRCGAASVTARGYTDYNSIGWRNLTVTEVYTSQTNTAYRGTKWRITNPVLYHLKTLEITYTGKASGTTPTGTSLSQVELNMTRPTTQMVPFVNKYSEQTLYYRLNAPQFKGVFEGNSSWYGTCATVADTAAKVVTCSGFVLATGARISVYFSTANTVNGAITLNVNSTGAKNMRVHDRNVSATNPLKWSTGRTLNFVYNGSAYVFIGYSNPMFEDIEGTVGASQLPLATTSDTGAVKPDGQSIIVANDGTITATPAAVGMTCTERSGGISLDTYDLETNSGSWPADGGWGWREEVWNDGRMTLYWWKWFATTGSGWQQLWTNLPYPTDATSFVDTPNTQVSLFDNAVSVQGAAMIKPTSLRTSSNTTGFKMTYYNSAANSNAKTLVLFRADGHWWKENVDPDDPTPAEEWAVGDAITIGGNSYYPVTEWKVSDSGAGGDSRLKAAVRFLITTSSTSGAWHVYAQYAAWTDSGYVPTSSQNSYMLIRKLNSQITTYTNDAGVKAKGDVWSTLNTNQRQGYVYNGIVSGNLIWGDTPYIITDCGTFTNGQTVSSKTFYVGTTEVNGGVYTQTSVSDTTTTPTS